MAGITPNGRIQQYLRCSAYCAKLNNSENDPTEAVPVQDKNTSGTAEVQVQKFSTLALDDTGRLARVALHLQKDYHAPI